MKQIAFAVLLALAAGTAAAQSADATSGSQSSAGSSAGAQSGSVSGATGNAVYIDNRAPTSTNANVSSSSSSTSTNTNTENVKYSGTTTQNVNYSGSQTVRNVPGVVVSGPASGPCNGLSGGLGFSGPGFGVGGNFSKVDEDCTARETARVAALMGRMDIANAVIENMPVVKAAMAAKNGPVAAPAARAEAPAPQAPTGAGLAQVTRLTDEDICVRARATDDKALAGRVCPKV